MADYQPRTRSTKEIAGRLDLTYLRRISFRVLWMSRIIWIAMGLAALASMIFAFGLLGSNGALSRGPLSAPHALFEERCEVCHTKAFNGIQDAACLMCHDAPTHPAKPVDSARLNFLPRCIQCHIEHRGGAGLTKVSDGNCRSCHNDLNSNASGVKIESTRITGFLPSQHPEFSPSSRPDLRPLGLNHALHMSEEPRASLNQRLPANMKLPMKCADCHVTDTNSPTGALLPVTFEQNCRPCHSKQLEFDRYNFLGSPTPAQHAKDLPTIHEFIVATYRKALAAEPGIVSRSVGLERAFSSSDAWLQWVVRDAETYLFGTPGSGRPGQCAKCHEFSGVDQGLPVVKKVNRIHGRYVEGSVEGEPWFLRGEFSHRAHREVQCESCHTKARTSTKTADVLIPVMKTCLNCHGQSHARLDRCSECHLYHNKSLEKDKRRSIGQVLSVVKKGNSR